MSPRPQDPCRATQGEFLAFVIVYARLLGARYEVEERQIQPHAHPVTMLSLLDLGIDPGVLEWMLFHAHVQHLQFVPGEEPAVARPVASVILNNETSAFALTESGRWFAEEFLARVILPENSAARFQSAWNSLMLGLLLPHYDSDERLFSWGMHLIKHFEQPRNQELILLAEQELRWPCWMDDPLARKRQRYHKRKDDPKTRLHDTIKNLNRCQISNLVHFKGDGTGTRVGWELR